MHVDVILPGYPELCLSVLVPPKGILLVESKERGSGVGDNCGLYGRVEVLSMDRLCREDMRDSMVVVGSVVSVVFVLAFVHHILVAFGRTFFFLVSSRK